MGNMSALTFSVWVSSTETATKGMENFSGYNIWALRKSALYAEIGEYNGALALLQDSLSNLRLRLAHQIRPDAFLVSLESPMMRLQSLISYFSISPLLSLFFVTGFGVLPPFYPHFRGLPLFLYISCLKKTHGVLHWIIRNMDVFVHRRLDTGVPQQLLPRPWAACRAQSRG